MHENSVRVTYTNNSGLLFSYDNVKILIDGLEEEENTFDSPPNNVKEYIEKNVCCKIKYISVGAERDALIEK